MLQPKTPRILESTSLSASSYCLRSRKSGCSPARSLARTLVPTPIAQLKSIFLIPPAFSTPLVTVV